MLSHRSRFRNGCNRANEGALWMLLTCIFTFSGQTQSTDVTIIPSITDTYLRVCSFSVPPPTSKSELMKSSWRAVSQEQNRCLPSGSNLPTAKPPVLSQRTTHGSLVPRLVKNYFLHKLHAVLEDPHKNIYECTSRVNMNTKWSVAMHAWVSFCRM